MGSVSFGDESEGTCLKVARRKFSENLFDAKRSLFEEVANYSIAFILTNEANTVGTTAELKRKLLCPQPTPMRINYVRARDEPKNEYDHNYGKPFQFSLLLR